MISKFDLSKLQDLPIEQVAEALDMTVKHHKTLCPFHSDSRPSLTFNRNKNKYRCYVCDAKGGSIDLVMHMMNLSFRDACHWLAKAFCITISDENDRRFDNVKPRKVVPVRPVTEPVEVKPDVAYLSRLMCQPVLNEQACKFLFDERKIRPEVVQQIGISSIDYNCPMSSSPKPSYYNGPALLIPYRDIDGNLMSVQARYLGSEDRPRFQFPKGCTCHIFNMDVLRTMKAGEPLFLTEGVSDCLAILSAGFKAIAIPSATLLKKEDTELLKGFTLHIYPDQDDAGQNLYLQLLEIFPTITRHNLPLGFKDVGAYYSYLHRDDKKTGF